MNKDELRQRIREGHRKIDILCGIVDELPRGPKRGELGDKSIRLLQSLHNLEDGFNELYPGACILTDKQCSNRNKGTFVCWECPTYMNALWGIGQEKLI